MRDPKFVARWRKAANAVLAARARSGNDVDVHSPVAGPSMAGMLRRLPDVGTAWTPDVDAIVTEYYLGRAWRGTHPDTCATFMAVRLGFAVATGSWAHVTSVESRAMRDLGFVVPDTEPTDPPRTPPPGPSFRADFSFVYEGTMPGGRSKAKVRSSGTVTVTRLPAGVASPAWSLPVPDGGPDLRVVSVDGILYRPVLRPGSWAPATEAEFAAACVGAEPWSDSPFVWRAERHRSPLGPRYAFPEGRVTAAGALAREAECRAAQARAAGLVSIDGIVHRPTTVPVLVLGAFGHRQDKTVAGWRVDDLTFLDEQAPLHRSGTERTCRLVEGYVRGLPADMTDVAHALATGIAGTRGRVAAIGFPVSEYPLAPSDTYGVVMDRLKAVLGQRLANWDDEGKRAREVGLKAVAVIDAGNRASLPRLSSERECRATASLVSRTTWALIDAAKAAARLPVHAPREEETDDELASFAP